MAGVETGQVELFERLVVPHLEKALDATEVIQDPNVQCQVLSLITSAVIGHLHAVCEEEFNYKGTLSEFSRAYLTEILKTLPSAIEKRERRQAIVDSLIGGVW